MTVSANQILSEIEKNKTGVFTSTQTVKELREDLLTYFKKQMKAVGCQIENLHLLGDILAKCEFPFTVKSKEKYYVRKAVNSYCNQLKKFFKHTSVLEKTRNYIYFWWVTKSEILEVPPTKTGGVPKKLNILEFRIRLSYDRNHNRAVQITVLFSMELYELFNRGLNVENPEDIIPTIQTLTIEAKNHIDATVKALRLTEI